MPKSAPGTELLQVLGALRRFARASNDLNIAYKPRILSRDLRRYQRFGQAVSLSACDVMNQCT